MPKKKKTEKKTESLDVVCVITGHSESGDDYGPWVFDKKPDDEFLKKFLAEHAPGEYPPSEDDGPGIFGTELHLRFLACTIDKVK